jgi:hypothetical protein
MAETFRPTDAMSAAAKRGMQLRMDSPRSRQGGTSIGVARARQFINQDGVSLDTVKRTYSFLSRAATYYKPGQNTPGTQAYLLWGGPAGLVWARKILKQQGEIE